MKAHPAADLYPLMEGVEFDQFVEDIRQNGQCDPVVIHDGAILDGRNRVRACQQLGLEPIVVEWNEDGTPEAFVTSRNLHRRHLTISQRGLIAAKIANMKSGDSATQRHGVGIPTPSISKAQAAAMLGVHRDTVVNAAKVLADGTAEEIDEVAKGWRSINSVLNKTNPQTPRRRRAIQGGPVPLSKTGRNPARIQQLKLKAEVWRKLRDSLAALSTLPKADDVVLIAKQMDKKQLVDDLLLRVMQWIEEFANGWTATESATESKNNQTAGASASRADQSGDRAFDSGDGDTVARQQQP
jgi:hypothetical protein